MPDMTIASVQVPAYGILQMVEVMQIFDLCTILSSCLVT